MHSSHGSLENTILNAIWFMEETNREIISVSDIQNRINLLNKQNWAYTTVKTVMDRLVEKTYITRLKKGKKYYYRSVYSRDEMGRKSILKIVKQYYNNDMESMLEVVKTLNKEYTAVLV